MPFVYNNIKSEILALLSEKQFTKKSKTKNIKNNKGTQLNARMEDPTDDESNNE